MANAVNNSNAKKDDLKIRTINITEGIKYKRYHFAGRGRTRPYMKRTSHINVVLEDNIKMEMPRLVSASDNESRRAKITMPKTETKPAVQEAEIVTEKKKGAKK